MHHVAKSLAHLFSDVLPHTDDEAWRSHLDDLTVVRNPVEGGMDRQPTFAEECLDVERNLNVCGIHIFVLDDDGIEFVLLAICHVDKTINC